MAIRFEVMQGFSPNRMPVKEIYHKISQANLEQVYEIFALKTTDFYRLYRMPMILVLVSVSAGAGGYLYGASRWILYAALALLLYGSARLIFIRASRPKLERHNTALRKYLLRVLEHKNTINDWGSFSP